MDCPTRCLRDMHHGARRFECIDRDYLVYVNELRVTFCSHPVCVLEMKNELLIWTGYSFHRKSTVVGKEGIFRNDKLRG